MPPPAAASAARPREGAVRLAMQRRLFLAGVSGTALLAATASSAAVTGSRTDADPARGMPFDDGTWFDDGYGWVD